MLSCREVAILAHDRLDGGLSRRQRLAMRVHLWMCAHCRRALRQLEAAVALARRTRDDAAPARDEADLLARFRAERGSEPR